MFKIERLGCVLLVACGLQAATGSDWSVGIRIGTPPGPRIHPHLHHPHHHHWHPYRAPSWGYYYRPYPVYVRPAPVVIRPAPVILEAPPTTVVVPAPSYSAPAPSTVPAAPAPFQPPAPRESVPGEGLRQTGTNVSLPNFEALLSSLRSTDENLRVRAALDLGRSREERAVDPLAATLAGDRSAAVRDAAARALGLLGSARGLTTLVHAAQADPDRDVRRSAQFAVEVIQSRQGR